MRNWESYNTSLKGRMDHGFVYLDDVGCYPHLLGGPATNRPDQENAQAAPYGHKGGATCAYIFLSHQVPGTWRQGDNLGTHLERPGPYAGHHLRQLPKGHAKNRHAPYPQPGPLIGDKMVQGTKNVIGKNECLQLTMSAPFTYYDHLWDNKD